MTPPFINRRTVIKIPLLTAIVYVASHLNVSIPKLPKLTSESERKYHSIDDFSTIDDYLDAVGNTHTPDSDAEDLAKDLGQLIDASALKHNIAPDLLASIIAYSNECGLINFYNRKRHAFHKTKLPLTNLWTHYAAYNLGNILEDKFQGIPYVVSLIGSSFQDRLVDLKEHLKTWKSPDSFLSVSINSQYELQNEVYEIVSEADALNIELAAAHTSHIIGELVSESRNYIEENPIITRLILQGYDNGTNAAFYLEPTANDEGDIQRDAIEHAEDMLSYLRNYSKVGSWFLSTKEMIDKRDQLVGSSSFREIIQYIVDGLARVDNEYHKWFLTAYALAKSKSSYNLLSTKEKHKIENSTFYNREYDIFALMALKLAYQSDEGSDADRKEYENLYRQACWRFGPLAGVKRQFNNAIVEIIEPEQAK